jgi:hypothetical protein
MGERLIEEISDYLNEYDDEGAGRWLAGSSHLVSHIASSPELRSLLGITESCPNCPPTSRCGIRKTVTALASRGHVIVRAEQMSDKEAPIPNAFHAGIGDLDPVKNQCHLVLNPELMDPNSFAHVIGDLFLDWVHGELTEGDHGGSSVKYAR